MTNPRIVTQVLSGNSLAAAYISGQTPSDWYEPIPADARSWRKRMVSVRSDFGDDWLEPLRPAFDATGKARDRLEAVAKGEGVLITTGQQPGLFGGPVYTLSKALSALALADRLQQLTGIPVAPVFWAATDDTDFKEASATVVATSAGAQLLRIDHAEPLGRPMASMPLGNVSAQLEALAHAAGSAVDPNPIEMLRRFYKPTETVGSAYVSFLRDLFAPLGITVVDASHPATRAAAKPLLVRALERSAEVAHAVKARSKEIEAAGFGLQVQDVPGLSLVFSSAAGSRKRIPIKSAAKKSDEDDLGPNVLLRPIVERSILPTAAYIGGPAEIAYFAQLGAIAETLDAARPAIVPRWSCFIIEPHVERTLEKLHLTPEDFREPHEAEARVARARLPKRVLDELSRARATIGESMSALQDAVAAENAPLMPAVTEGLRANLARRIDRFERRLIAASKKEHADVMREIAAARGSLYPLGKPQERALNFVPLLARYGSPLREEMLTAARQHAQQIAGGTEGAQSLEGTGAESAR